MKTALGIRDVGFKSSRKRASNENEVNSIMQKLPFSKNDVLERCQGVLGPLSLFAPYPHEDEPPPEKLELDRPVTPIDMEIKAPPLTFQKLGKFIRRRISPNSQIEHLTTGEQQELAGVIMGEVNGIWRDLRKQVDDPFLSPEQNKELQRRICVHIVTVCAELFTHYVQKAQILNKRGVFSGPANMSRLKAQLALDSNKFLNILTIRRYIVSDLRGKREDLESRPSTDYPRFKAPVPPQTTQTLSYKGLIQSSRPKSQMRRYKFKTAAEELQELDANMPNLETSKLMSIIADLPEAPRSSASSTPNSSVGMGTAHVGKDSTVLSRQDSASNTRDKVLLKKSHSLPHLSAGETLAEELGLEDSDASSTVTSKGLEAIKHNILLSTDKAAGSERDGEARGGKSSKDLVREDLEKLTAAARDDTHAADEEEDEDEEMPPLLQAITRSAKHDGKDTVLKKQLKDLEEKELQRQKRERLKLQEPSHPQPATVATKMPNKMVVRTSDIRVSERVCLSSITIQQNTTVYNDLLDEIDPETVKKLDKNLFLSEEIQEVYKEIMQTVPTDHLRLDEDDLVKPVADAVSLSTCLASASLAKPSGERVVNQHLQRDKTPPWGQMDPKSWVKTPQTPPVNKDGEPHFDPQTPNVEKLSDLFGEQSLFQEGKPTMPDTSHMPAMMKEVASRSYASWLNWWKNTVNSDDYMKYISTQESDYLGLLFHFYDSEEDNGDGEETSEQQKTKSQKAVEIKEKEKKLEEMKTQKTEFKEGFWNVNSILMGGLGKDPVIEGAEVDEEERAGSADSASSKSQQQQAAGTKPTISWKSGEVGPQNAGLTLKKQEGAELLKARAGCQSRTATAASQRTVWTVQSKRDTETQPEVEVGPDELLTPQDRLERVWASLQMPDAHKLDMAIKYSSDDFHHKLEEAISVWEKATFLILQREAVVAKLESFERMASDPNRFFEKGYRGSSVARLEEAKLRAQFYRKLDQLDNETSAAVQYVRDNFQDSMSFQGRPYLEKMQWDRTEMLYWLQEERRQQALEHEAKMREIPMKVTHLAPIVHNA